jgi:hypothetical protein
MDHAYRTPSAIRTGSFSSEPRWTSSVLHLAQYSWSLQIWLLLILYFCI